MEIIDDIVAIILALATPNIDVRAITLTHGNTTIGNTVRNATTLFSVLEKQTEYYKTHGGPTDKFQTSRPALAIGAAMPIKSTQILASYFHGEDGLGEIHTTASVDQQQHPHFTYKDWQSLIISDQEILDAEDTLYRKEKQHSPLYTTSPRSGCDEILFQLAQAQPFTVTIVAVGPLTNLALALENDPKTFCLAKRIIILGGAIDVPGNTSPFAEFNFLADAHAAKAVLETTHGYKPNTTIEDKLALHQTNGWCPLHVVMLSIDAGEACSTFPVSLLERYSPTVDTPLSQFITPILEFVADKSREYGKRQEHIALFDPVCIGLLLDFEASLATKTPKLPVQDQTAKSYLHRVIESGRLIQRRGGWTTYFEDVRVETEGEFTRGMCCVDRRVFIGKQWTGVSTNVEVVREGPNASFLQRVMEAMYDIHLND
ncbi:hypothetical protein BZG36_04791 [Bifiguratus adelaidae]|uniref:Inosine/uridine-preferring nucleoside hydrolase domain-containing protein n=1 Tax=Bifiguratus adelaidae TaxID=1938954 RepID=A0A261XTY6_9FUNG|nr:hypothetical protein BZG36_04791 [Bifiguratus adelaidae]